MSAKLAYGLVVAAILAATLAAAIAAYLVSRDAAEEERDDRIAIAREAALAAFAAREDFLRDLSALAARAPGEVAGFARIQARDERAVVSVRWIRAPAAGSAPAAAAAPVLLPPGPVEDRDVIRVGNPVAARVVARTRASGRPAVSPPVELTNGDPAFYLAAPVEVGPDRGGAVVGLVHGRRLLAAQLAPSAPDVVLADGGEPVAVVGDAVEDPAEAALPVRNRTWTVSVDGASVSGFTTAVPWVILLSGFGLALVVAILLGRAVSRRDAALEVARRRESELEQRSREDELTGIFNRRHFTETLTAALAAREGPRLAAILLDLDHFKAINDSHGHLTGDLVLQVAAQRLASVVRPSETLARWGGEEFAVLASGLDREGALALGERLRTSIADVPIEVKDEVIELSASVGIALSNGLRDPDAVVGAADDALYEAKAAGRNRVVIADPRRTERLGSSRA